MLRAKLGGECMVLNYMLKVYYPCQRKQVAANCHRNMSGVKTTTYYIEQAPGGETTTYNFDVD